MSKRANNLRKRIRIQAEQAASRGRQDQRLRAELERAKRDLRRAEESPGRSVMVRVEELPRGAWGDVYGATIHFHPHAYVFAATRMGDGLTNLSYIAEDVGYRIGRMVTAEIMKKMESQAWR